MLQSFIEILAIFSFFVLLASAIYLLLNIYVCDSHKCKAFNYAETKGPPDTKRYIIALLGELCNDGIWPLPYIGAAILTPLSLWFIGMPMTVKNFAFLFFISFVVIYMMFSFFIHHYINIISRYTSENIRENYPTSQNLTISQQETNLREGTIHKPIYKEEDPEDTKDTKDPSNFGDVCHQNSETSGVNSYDISSFEPSNDGIDVSSAKPVNIF
jgi:hypothetical protein